MQTGMLIHKGFNNLNKDKVYRLVGWRLDELIFIVEYHNRRYSISRDCFMRMFF